MNVNNIENRVHEDETLKTNKFDVNSRQTIATVGSQHHQVKRKTS
jgi:hypothetical protein